MRGVQGTRPCEKDENLSDLTLGGEVSGNSHQLGPSAAGSPSPGDSDWGERTIPELDRESSPAELWSSAHQHFLNLFFLKTL